MQINLVCGHSAFVTLAQLLASGKESFPEPSQEVLVHHELVHKVTAADIQITHENGQTKLPLCSLFISVQDYKL